MVGLTYQHHEISRVFAGTRRIGKETERATKSTLLEVHYGITDRLSVSSTLNFVQKDRTTGTDGSNDRSALSTSGVGDALVFVSYTLFKQSLWKHNHVSVGAGVKAPFGSSSLRRDGLRLNADMQPGTGSWDGIFMANWSHSMLPRTKASIFASARFRYSGTNERFTSTDRYRFGNESFFSLGVANSAGTKAAYSLAFLFRASRQDKRNDARIINTGGRWISVAPSVQYSLSPKTDVRMGGGVPVFQKLRGTQPSTSFTAAVSFFYKFAKSEQVFSKRRLE